MTQPEYSADTTTQTAEPAPGEEPAFRCEQCGTFRARYVVADLEESDTSLFCGSCMVLTFAKVANDLMASEQ